MKKTLLMAAAALCMALPAQAHVAGPVGVSRLDEFVTPEPSSPLFATPVRTAASVSDVTLAPSATPAGSVIPVSTTLQSMNRHVPRTSLDPGPVHGLQHFARIVECDTAYQVQQIAAGVASASPRHGESRASAREAGIDHQVEFQRCRRLDDSDYIVVGRDSVTYGGVTTSYLIARRSDNDPDRMAYAVSQGGDPTQVMLVETSH